VAQTTICQILALGNCYASIALRGLSWRTLVKKQKR